MVENKKVFRVGEKAIYVLQEEIEDEFDLEDGTEMTFVSYVESDPEYHYRFSFEAYRWEYSGIDDDDGEYEYDERIHSCFKEPFTYCFSEDEIKRKNREIVIDFEN